MADIKQAAKWLREGKTVRRTANNYELYAHNGREDSIVFHERNQAVDTAVFLIGDLLAEDWEIAQ